LDTIATTRIDYVRVGGWGNMDYGRYGRVFGVGAHGKSIWLYRMEEGVYYIGANTIWKANKEDSIKDTNVSESADSPSPLRPIFSHLNPATISTPRVMPDQIPHLSLGFNYA